MLLLFSLLAVVRGPAMNANAAVYLCVKQTWICRQWHYYCLNQYRK
jgi:hypothetical protein